MLEGLREVAALPDTASFALIPAGRPLPAMPAIVRLRRPARVDDAIDRTARRVGLLGRRRRAVAALKLSCLTLSTPP